MLLRDKTEESKENISRCSSSASSKCCVLSVIQLTSKPSKYRRSLHPTTVNPVLAHGSYKRRYLVKQASVQKPADFYIMGSFADSFGNLVCRNTSTGRVLLCDTQYIAVNLGSICRFGLSNKNRRCSVKRLDLRRL
jgi:hypothetical protein